MTDATFFLVQELRAIRPDGTHFDIVTRLGKPASDDGPHACVVQTSGTEIGGGDPIRIHGEGPMQALHLALELIRAHLECEEARGVRFVWPGSDDAFDWRRFWYGDGPAESAAG